MSAPQELLVSKEIQLMNPSNDLIQVAVISFFLKQEIETIDFTIFTSGESRVVLKRAKLARLTH